MIRLEAVSKHFEGANKQRFTAVENISLQIRDGEIFGLMGYSGAGKSTLLRLMNLLERPETGKVFLNNAELTAMSPKQLRLARRKIGMIFQQFNLMTNRTVFENVAYALKIAEYPKDKRAARVRECLEIVGLWEKAHAYPARLSGGQKQRVGIARALASGPEVILADEPTSALDPLTTNSVLSCLADINQRFGVTIVIVTHEMSVIRRLCHRAALLNHGHLLETIHIENGQFTAQTDIGKALTEQE
ncbi:methionine ABC transporter ATP-binding protein [Suttonella ornithocola]|uniref:Cell division ATP-binding protein FtsE n=1 Tax=Suttonella ornithocola TaxID=279832 RepID=A0A380MQF1_9GAMM|nr:methionine ABC transporter ATP-binding protein [Suttonella ornithocola]SUO93941.1 Methionine import ATP-binding protein MetN [Suttonella ornithocola]